MHDPSGRKGASDISARVAMNAPKNPEGKRWSCAGDSEEIDEDAAAGGVWEKAEDKVAAAGGARWVLKENPNEVGSVGACGAVAGVDCAK